MLMIDKQKTADLIDLAKSALICDTLDLGFGMPAEGQAEPIVLDPAGVIGGLAMAFEIMGLTFPTITETDIAEFKEINAIS